MSTQYDTDFYAWLQEQAALLKARRFDALDLDNLVEEVESVARQECHLLHHRFRTLLTHLVAWWGMLPEHCIRWQHVIASQRYELQTILEDSPSLLAVATRELLDAWAQVRAESQEHWPYAVFPMDCPWPITALLDEDFFPALDTFGAQARKAPDAPQPPVDADR
jgi:hypothetical protein